MSLNNQNEIFQYSEHDSISDISNSQDQSISIREELKDDLTIDLRDIINNPINNQKIQLNKQLQQELQQLHQVKNLYLHNYYYHVD